MPAKAPASFAIILRCWFAFFAILLADSAYHQAAAAPKMLPVLLSRGA